MIIYYDNKWNTNEWFVIGLLLIGLTLLVALPKRFPLNWSTVYTLYGVFTGLCLDHTLSVNPVDFYDVNDNSSYEFMDFLTYVMYGPFTYLFAYLHDTLKVKPPIDPLFVFGWSLLSVVVEWVAVQAGVFHYKNGYTIFYSFPIYLSSLYLLFLAKMNGFQRKLCK
ncbi:hypothetical protein DVH26_22035 [Paenibacillus sp. H1-7]|uniref:hypothetical protein n=1 Tax=Paenibacillus sp. H1-7 TaxID=2282849 RepID=UPI001EF89D35|nr:hypothetical protein [Paenibacillus sp. H1-7]ULL16888.1 hypothetical protein DVH26_22035 [Paenibacillus sp. H1-7]